MKKELKNRKRTLSRLMTVQIFYQYEFFEKKQNLDEIKENLIENYVLFEGEEPQSYHDKIDKNLINNLLNSIANEIAEIDENILNLQNNSQKIDNVARQIIRFATLELKLFQDIDFKIIINEYVDIAAHFFSETKVSFINSILNNLAQKYR